jgi:large subunit ribosomal protein L10
MRKSFPGNNKQKAFILCLRERRFLFIAIPIYEYIRMILISFRSIRMRFVLFVSLMQTKRQKKQIVEDLTEKLKNSKAAVFSDYSGLAVKDMMAMRKELRSQGIDFKIAKKTLISLALKNAKMDADVKKMEGQLALAISTQDEVAAAKILAKTAKENDNLKILGGFLGEKFLEKEEVMALSRLPGKDELLAKLVGALNSPVSGLVNVLAGNLRGLVNVLKVVAGSKTN